jgi:aryl-alcohol dehydrogenase-like predicted oxidoreductase
MEYKAFGRLKWQITEIGYGMWGMRGDWDASDDARSAEALDLAVELGCNFFDTAWIYGKGRSERLAGAMLKRQYGKMIYVASKIPPKNFSWPSRRGYAIDDCFPADHIRKYTEKSLQNLGIDQIDLMQFHVWEDDWADREEWQRCVEDLKKEGKVHAFGISVNRWEPWNVLRTLHTELIDAVQVIYNIFDQNPEDELFPLCEELNVAVIARVPFDEGTLTGKLSRDTVFDDDDWRKRYFVPENLESSVSHAEALAKDLPEDMSMPEASLRFILNHPAVSTVIPGMRQLQHVRANIAVSDGSPLEKKLLNILRQHRWDRQPTKWSM